MSDLARYVDGLVEGRRGTLVQEKRGLRWVWRVEEAGGEWFAKRGVAGRREELRRETANARALASMGLGPAVLAAGAHDRAEWLVLARAQGRELFLSFVCRAGPVSEAVWRPRRRALLAVARGVRGLHESGFALPDISVWHAFTDGDATHFIDAARMDRSRGPTSIERRARDFASLLFSFPSLDVGRTERLRLVREASGLRGDALQLLLRRIDGQLERRAAKTRWRHAHFQNTFDFGLALIAGKADHLSFIDADFGRAAMTVVRTLRDRENRRLSGHRGPDFFVKVFPPTKKGWSPAMRELAAIDLFQRAGVLVNRVAAYAEDVDKGSMVAVKAAAGEPLDDLLRRGVPVAERRALAVQTARIWRRMRECGLRHRDAYPCHLFVAKFVVPASAGSLPSRKANDPAEAGTTNPRHELRLIDLTRAGRAPFPKERWFVEDAAALWHGVPRPPVTRTDAIRWLREYFRVAKLDACAKRFARRVAAKERRIAARQKRKGR